MRDTENIHQLAAIQPDYMGFIFYEKSKRYVESLDRLKLGNLPASIKKTGVFVDAAIEEIEAKISLYKLEAIQLHGQETPEFCGLLKQAGLEVIKAFGVDNQFDFNLLNRYDEAVDYFLFDTKTDKHGGSGMVFDWNLLQNYTLSKPYFLSGGLDTEHLNELLNIPDQRLYALDLNSRFELEPGLKDIQKLTSFFNAIRIPV
ncbi:MAG: phosphoribosylanthranilate isomerase [Sphingobacteriaceae bacterium]|nr:phosphoribosylanthranilate isomerase [Sphingobacteriaceae bacterium]